VATEVLNIIRISGRVSLPVSCGDCLACGDEAVVNEVIFSLGTDVWTADVLEVVLSVLSVVEGVKTTTEAIAPDISDVGARELVVDSHHAGTGEDKVGEDVLLRGCNKHKSSKNKKDLGHLGKGD